MSCVCIGIPRDPRSRHLPQSWERWSILLLVVVRNWYWTGQWMARKGTGCTPVSRTPPVILVLPPLGMGMVVVRDGGLRYVAPPSPVDAWLRSWDVPAPPGLRFSIKVY